MGNGYTKATWIAKQLQLSPDDVLDVLLGNIKLPQDLIDSVNQMADEYEADIAKHA